MLKNNLSNWGLLLFVFAVGTSLLAYYSQVIPYTREASFWLMLFAIMLLLGSMIKDVYEEINTYILSIIMVAALMIIYFMLRQELHRFDFGVGDASDYFIAGVCSVTYAQDIGFFMPLMAAISGVGYDVLGLEYTPWINVLLHSMTIPVGYFIFRKLELSAVMALLSSVVIVFAPSSIWFAKTSFSEVLWQLFLLLFVFLSYKIIKKEVIEIKYVITIWLMMFLLPFIRGEGALYFGLLSFLALFHFWRHQHFKSALSILVGLFILSASINITAILRPVYLLEWQFSRIIPNITADQLSLLLYGTSGVVTVLLLGLYVIRNVFSKIKIPLIITILAIVLKITIAYLYAMKKSLVFSDLLFFNEYELALNNFGLPLTLLILAGLILLHYKAIMGNFVALLLVVVYIIFYVPFVMQAVTFEDVHAFFFYWNRYYFSVIMMVHLFALGLSFEFIFKRVSYIIKKKLNRYVVMIVGILGISFLSMDSKLHTIVTKEAHHKGSYKLYPWLKNHVNHNSFVVVYDSSVKYEQNKAHIGNYHLKTLTARAFSTFKIYAKGWEAVAPDKLKNGYEHKLDTKKNKFVLCLSSDECHLYNKNLVKVDSILLPIEWREHFGLSKNAVDIHQGDVKKSIINKFDLHAVLYEVQEEAPTNGIVSFRTSSKYAKNMLKKGWHGIVNGNGALSVGNKAQLRIRNMRKKEGKEYKLMLQYIIMNISKKKPRTLRFSINGEKISDVLVDSQFNDYNINIPNRLLSTKNAEMLLEIERVDSNGKKLGVILESLRVTVH